jgi:hypothetical protein
VERSAALTQASDLMCKDANRTARILGAKRPCNGGQWNRNVRPRYIPIFDSRPGYPLVAAPFVKVLGVWRGMVIATLMIGVAVGVLAYVGVRLTFGSRLAGLAAPVLIYVLPSGFWISRLMADGMMLAGYLAAIVGLTVYWRHGRWQGFPLVVMAGIWTYAAKPANGTILAGGLLLVGGGALLLRHRRRLASILTTGLGFTLLLGWFAISARLRLPGLSETIQDDATGHFTRPDVADPFGFVVSKNLELWQRFGENTLVSPWPVLLLAFSLVVLVRAGHLGWVWSAIGLTSVIVVAVHPVLSEFERLIAPIWLPITAGISYSVAVTLRAIGSSQTGAHLSPSEQPATS